MGSLERLQDEMVLLDALSQYRAIRGEAPGHPAVDAVLAGHNSLIANGYSRERANQLCEAVSYEVLKLEGEVELVDELYKDFTENT